jgi:predicted nucleic acid-binding protein
MLVKLYIDEPDADEVRTLTAAADVVVTSVAAYPEARAAFARRRRERLMTPAEHARAIRQLDADWPRLLRIDLDDALALAAGRLADGLALRGYDAVHLAAFEELLARCDDDDVRFACADGQLVRAARSLT